MSNASLMRKRLDDLLQDIIDNCKSKVTAEKVKKINEICEDLYEKGVRPSIALIVKILNKHAIEISTQTIYNQRENGNPYRQIIDAWIELSQSESAQAKVKVSKADLNSQIIEQGDLEKINDPVLRYRVALLMGEVRGLRNQLNIARELSKLPVIYSGPGSSETTSKTSEIWLSQYDLDILSELNAGSASLGYDEDGALVAKTSIRIGKKLSSPGLKIIFTKILSRHSLI